MLRQFTARMSKCLLLSFMTNNHYSIYAAQSIFQMISLHKYRQFARRYAGGATSHILLTKCPIVYSNAYRPARITGQPPLPHHHRLLGAQTGLVSVAAALQVVSYFDTGPAKRRQHVVESEFCPVVKIERAQPTESCLTFFSKHLSFRFCLNLFNAASRLENFVASGPVTKTPPFPTFPLPLPFPLVP